MRIELFYDVVSPYSRVAFEALTRWAPLWEATLVLRPFFLGGAMKATGNEPPANLPARGTYMMQDLERVGRYFEAPLVLPNDFPKRTLSPMRVLVQIEEQASEHLEAATRALFDRCWGGGDEDVNDPAVLLAALRAAGLDDARAERFVAGIADPEVKARLARVTDEAVARGAFGAPTFFVRRNDDDDDEMFFGSDRIPLMAWCYGKPYPGPVPGRPA